MQDANTFDNTYIHDNTNIHNNTDDIDRTIVVSDTRIHHRNDIDQNGFTWFPTLWKKNAKGSVMIWSVGWNNKGVKRSESATWKNKDGNYGRLKFNNRQMEPYKRESYGTVVDRAMRKAKSDWTEKRRSYMELPINPNYVDDRIYPSLCKKWDDVKEKNYPYIVQPKYDGNRAIFRFEQKDDTVKIYSKTMKLYSFMDHLRDRAFTCIQFLSQITGLTLNDCIIDGEIYTHGMSHQEIRSRVQRTEELHPDEISLELHIFDIILQDKTTQERFQYLIELNDKIQEEGGLSHVYITPSRTCQNENEVLEYFEELTDLGYEGLVLRESSLKYICKNNYKHNRMLKLKGREYAEGIIIGGKEATGTNKGGCIVWNVRDIATDNEFWCSQKGEVAYQRQLYLELDIHIGKIFTYALYGRSDDGMPIMPIGIDFRDPRDVDIEAIKREYIQVNSIKAKSISERGIKVDSSTSLDGCRIAISGRFWLKQSEIIELIEKNGGEYAKRVVGTTTHLVTKDINSTAQKIVNAKEKGIKIVDEEFLKRFA